MKYWRIVLDPSVDVWQLCRDNDRIALGYDDKAENRYVEMFKNDIKIDDKIIAYLKKANEHYRIGAIGTIIGEYRIDERFGHDWYRRVREVTWDHCTMLGFYFGENELSENLRGKLSQRATIVELTKDEYDEVHTLIMNE